MTSKKKPRYRSKFEARVAAQFGKKALYEPCKIVYYVPESKHFYIPDFVVGNIFIEVKGLLDAAARKKMILVKEQHPEHDIRFLFMRDQPIRKGSPTLYSDWAEKHGFPFAFKEVPEEWL